MQLAQLRTQQATDTCNTAYGVTTSTLTTSGDTVPVAEVTISNTSDPLGYCAAVVVNELTNQDQCELVGDTMTIESCRGYGYSRYYWGVDPDLALGSCQRSNTDLGQDQTQTVAGSDQETTEQQSQPSQQPTFIDTVVSTVNTVVASTVDSVVKTLSDAWLNLFGQ